MLQLHFRTTRFLPYLPEASQVNPGAYGFELAQWLSQALMQAGIVTSYPLGEDWGWFIEYFEDEFECMVGCAAVAEEGEGYLAQPVDWRIFVKAQRSLKQRLQGRDARAVCRKLAGAILATLLAEGIHAELTED